MKSSAELRSMARQTLAGNWVNAVLVYLIYSVISAAASYLVSGINTFVGCWLSLLITAPLSLGVACYFLSLLRGMPVDLDLMFEGFKQYGRALGLVLLISLLVFLGTLLLIVPGIILALAYSMAVYIYWDEPELGVWEAMQKSSVMMKGYKGKLFLLGLSFIGWMFLSVLTLGIGFLWLAPYMQTATAAFYEELKNNSSVYVQMTSENIVNMNE